MGAISPVPFADDTLMQKIEQRIVIPTVEGLQKENIDYKGFVFIGLIKVGDDPFVIEYNVRMGDPETEVVLPRIKTDLVDVFEATFKQSLPALDFELDPRAAATVMLVSGGYPEAYEKGAVISGLETVSDSIVFHAGTAMKDGAIVTSGGRVIAVTSMDVDYKKAIKKSYQNIEKLSFSRMNFRTDIGFDLY
jgi:phosphoribosylamine--glycine ligase